MKRLIILAVLMLAATLGSVAQEVVGDSVPAAAGRADSAGRALGDEPRQRSGKKKPNVIGAPVYYDMNGNVIGGKRQSDVYHRPKHHYFNNLSDRYCSVFAEGMAAYGAGSFAAGFNLAVLPKRWGAYGTAMLRRNDGYLSVGPALRLSGYNSSLDWQLYGGLVVGEKKLGAEGGIRLAVAKRGSEFCFTSVSLGLTTLDGDVMATLGLSLDVVAVMAAATWLYW